MNPDLYQELVKQISSLQKQIDALVKPEVGRWVNWTPTIDQGGAVTYNAGTSYARYCVVSDIVTVLTRLVVTGAGVGGNAIIIGGIPATVQVNASYPAGGASVIGTALVVDTGTAFYQGALDAVNVASWSIMAHNQGNYVGAAPNFALANGDFISFMAAYER